MVSFFLATTLATQAIFLKRREREYNFRIWAEVKVSNIDVDKTTGNEKEARYCYPLYLAFLFIYSICKTSSGHIAGMMLFPRVASDRIGKKEF